jgi:hypothetical protein
MNRRSSVDTHFGQRVRKRPASWSMVTADYARIAARIGNLDVWRRLVASDAVAMTLQERLLRANEIVAHCAALNAEAVRAPSDDTLMALGHMYDVIRRTQIEAICAPYGFSVGYTDPYGECRPAELVARAWQPTSAPAVNFEPTALRRKPGGSTEAVALEAVARDSSLARLVLAADASLRQAQATGWHVLAPADAAMSCMEPGRSVLLIICRS